VRTSVALLALALVGCAHPSPAPPPPPLPLATHAPPAPPPLAAPPPPAQPPGSCIPSPLQELAASIPACAGVPADLLEVARLKEAPLGSHVSVRGFLVLGNSECTLMACLTVDKSTGERRPAPCCNSCQAFWRLAGPDEARASSPAPGRSEIFLRPMGTVGPFQAGGRDCVMDAIAAGPRLEIIASGLWEPARMGSYLGSNAPAGRSIDDATLCTTGRWISPRAKAPGPLPGCQ
jgi:hypothetical protein